ncbi:hypothetical protein [Klebsiella aerogenes]|uniref:hypothetical protein n=1 Tax=Klebsiella aerogenes TaxID=548 RepID=UPI001F3E9659|nr:hypothetical protein [Klebsiella aerogenes]
MSPQEFIKKHIIEALMAEGFSEQIAREAECGVDHYRRMSQRSRKGRACDDCLYFARQWASGQTTVAEHKAGKKKPGRAATQPGLF